jgi:acyl-CoA thioesterase
VDALTFYGLERTGDPWRWRLPVVRGLASGFGTLFGGCALGAAIEVLERSTGRPLVWATAQFLDFASPPDVVDLEVNKIVRGNQVSQGRVLARVDGREIFTVLGALGARTFPWEGTWAGCPDVTPPAESQPRQLMRRHQGTILERLEVRLASARAWDGLDGTPAPDGRSALWVRLPPELEASAAALAIAADYVPFGIGQALGRRTASTSLDNTLRMVRAHPCEWVLADIRVQAVTNGLGHGVVHLWADDRTLLATASQSVVVREWAPDRDAKTAR